TEGAIDTLSRGLDEDPSTGIIAPMITNSDGSIQRSLRRFPTPLDQFVQLFKIDHLFPKLSAVSRYLADDVDYTREQEGFQPMGAALMMRVDLFKKLAGFDERFFIWFEEVDLCKRAMDARYRVRYTPHAKVIHRGGESFGKHLLVRKQFWVFRSASQYLEKHFGLRAWWATIPMKLASVALGFFVNEQSRLWAGACMLSSVAYLFSYLSYFFPALSPVGWIVLVGSVAVFSFRRLEIGLWMLAAELILDSKGYLFSLDVFSFPVSLRMGLFAAVLGVWVVHCIRDRGIWRNSFRTLPLVPLVALVLAFLWGVVWGVVQNNDTGKLFRDANGWLYFLLLPVFMAVLSDRKTWMRLALVAGGAFFAQTLLVLKTFYLLGHQGFGFDLLYSFYRWIRTTGIGEVVTMDFGFTRVFFQSQIFTGFAVCMGLVLLSRVRSFTLIARMGLVLALSSLIASLSRSFFMAIGVGVVVWIVLSLRDGIRVSRLVRSGVLFLASAGVAFALLFVIAIVPIPSPEAGFGWDALAKRFQNLDSEEAAASRWKLLPALIETIREQPILGHGFGKTVTYLSSDPRLADQGTPAPFTTFTFEWGYLDFFVKLGILGGAAVIIFFLWVLVRLLRAAAHMRALHDPWHPVATSLAVGYVFLLTTHFFTPYLVHPLGIGIVLCLIAFSNLIEKDTR
ncbi:MAG: O-antigen ligase family protein, partial [Patescibacteria group bacterium]